MNSIETQTQFNIAKREFCSRFSLSALMALLFFMLLPTGVANASPTGHQVLLAKAANGNDWKDDSDWGQKKPSPSDSKVKNNKTSASGTEKENDTVQGTLSCYDCVNIQRINPFFGITTLWSKIAIFIGIVLLFYLLSIAIFRSQVSSGKTSIIGSATFAIILVLIFALFGAWLSFSEYTWNSCWCKGMMRSADGSVILSPSAAISHINWLYWGIALLVTIVIAFVLKLLMGSTKQDPIPNDQDDNNA